MPKPATPWWWKARARRGFCAWLKQKTGFPTGLVVCMEYSAEQCELVRSLGIADLVVQADGQKPLKAYEAYLKATGGRLADFSVNTVNVHPTRSCLLFW